MDRELYTMTITCPNCGENVQILIDAEDDGDTYIEDCQVCCSPINITVTIDEREQLMVQAHSDDEVW